MAHGTQRKQREIDALRGRMAAKKILPMAFLVMWLLAMALVWWVALAPGRWRTDTIAYVRMGTAEVNFGRGVSSVSDVLIAADGRQFAVSDEEKDALCGKLQYGEECEIVYAKNPIGMGPESLKSLSTAENGQLVTAEAALAQVREERRGMLWLIVIPVALFMAVEVLIDRFGCKKERAEIARLKAKQAKFAAREENRRVQREQGGR